MYPVPTNGHFCTVVPSYKATPTQDQPLIRPLPPKTNLLLGHSHPRPTSYKATPTQDQPPIRPLPPKTNLLLGQISDTLNY
jgi:hypothetical protein